MSPSKENKKPKSAYGKKVDSMVKAMDKKRREMDCHNALVQQLRESKNFDEWKASPVPFGDINEKMSTDKCLEALYYYIKEDVDTEVKRTKWQVEELDEIQTLDHKLVAKHEEKLDQVIASAIRMKSYLFQAKQALNLKRDEAQSQFLREMHLEKAEMRGILSDIESEMFRLQQYISYKKERVLENQD